MRLSGMHTQSIAAQVRSIPPERFAAKIKRTVWGVAFIAAAVALAKYTDASPWLYVPLGLVGAHIASGELVATSVKWVFALVKDAVALVRGKNGA